MSKVIFVLSVQFDTKEEAEALRSIIDEMHFSTSLRRYVYAEVGDKPVTPISQTRLGRIIFEEMVPGVHYGREDFSPILESCGYKAISAQPVLSKLVNEGKVRRIERNVYVREEEDDEGRMDQSGKEDSDENA